MAQTGITWDTTRLPLDASRRDLDIFGIGRVHRGTYSDVAAVTAPLASQFVRVWCSSDALVSFGDPALGQPMTARMPEKLVVPEPGVSRLSAVQMQAGGYLFVTELL